MVTVAEFTVPTDELPSGVVFARLPGLTVELERIVPTEDVIVPYAWIHGVDVDEIERVVEAFPEEKPHPDLRGLELIDRVDDDVLVRFEWEANVRGLLRPIAESDVVLVSAVGTADRWHVEVRGEDRAAVSDFQQRCIENDVPVELVALHSVVPLRTRSDSVLTEAQREALLLAYERGYFRSPRETTLAEVADELGITGQSLGSRLRRGIERLVAEAVVDAEAGDG